MNYHVAYGQWKCAALRVAKAGDREVQARYERDCRTRGRLVQAAKAWDAAHTVFERDDRYTHGIGSHAERVQNWTDQYQAVIDTGYDRLGGVFQYWVDEQLAQWAAPLPEVVEGQ